MNSQTSRMAGADLLAFLSAPSRRAVSRRTNPLTHNYRRTVASSSRNWQQQQQAQQAAPAANKTSPTPSNTAPRTPTATTTSTPQTTPSQPPPDPPQRSLTDSLADPPPTLSPDEKQVDWTRSFHGLSSSPFTPEQSSILQADIPPDDIEIKPDGIIYLPEIKYRRILNKAFMPGGWGLAPRGETIVTGKVVTREYGLVAGGRLISVARGEQAYFDADGIPTATEGCKSNALMRCCKDLGIASELWDPRFVRRFLKESARETVVENVNTKKRRKHWMRADDEVRWPWKDVGGAGTGGALKK